MLLLLSTPTPTKYHYYETDELTEQHRHTVLLLPVAHYELNQIELAWEFVEDYVAKQNVNFKLSDIERLIPLGFEHTTTDMWQNFADMLLIFRTDTLNKTGLWRI